MKTNGTVSDLLDIPEFVERQLSQQASASPLPWVMRRQGRLYEIMTARQATDNLVAGAVLPQDAVYLVDAANRYPVVLRELLAERRRSALVRAQLARCQRDLGILMALVILVVVVFSAFATLLLS